MCNRCARCWPKGRGGGGGVRAPILGVGCRFSAPEGRQDIAWGVSPRNGRPNPSSEPRRGDRSVTVLSPLRGSGKLGRRRFLGLTPQAISCRPSGAKKGLSPAPLRGSNHQNTFTHPRWWGREGHSLSRPVRRHDCRSETFVGGLTDVTSLYTLYYYI